MTGRSSRVLAFLIILNFISKASLAENENFVLKTGMDIRQVQKVEVNRVKIENFAGSVIINTAGTGKNTLVSLKGSEELLSQVSVQNDKDILHIAFKKDAPIVKDMDSLVLSIDMPATMPLELELFGGKAVVGARESDNTVLNINGFGDIKAESMRNLESLVSGSGEITIKKINGNAKIRIEGDGKYDIQNGSIPSLKAKIQGTGVMNIAAKVKDADLTSEGAGKMKLATVEGKLQQTISGSGTITISKITGSLKNRSLPMTNLKMGVKN